MLVLVQMEEWIVISCIIYPLKKLETGNFEVYYQRIKMWSHFFMAFDYFSSIISFLSSNHSKKYEKWIISQCSSFWVRILYILANRKERTEMQVACFVLFEKYGSTALECRLFIWVLHKENHPEDYNFTCHSIHSFRFPLRWGFIIFFKENLCEMFHVSRIRQKYLSHIPARNTHLNNGKIIVR